MKIKKLQNAGSIPEITITAYAPSINTAQGKSAAKNMASRLLSGQDNTGRVPISYYNYVTSELNGAIPTRQALNKTSEKILPYVAGSAFGPAGIIASMAGEAINTGVNAATKGDKDSWGDLFVNGEKYPIWNTVMDFTNPGYLLVGGQPNPSKSTNIGVRMLNGETQKQILNKAVKDFGKNIKLSDSPTVQNILAGKIGWAPKTTETLYHHSNEPLAELDPMFKSWDVVEHGAPRGKVWLTEDSGTAGFLAERPYHQTAEITLAKPMVQVGESVGNGKNIVRNDIVKFAQDAGADGIQFKGIADNQLPNQNITASFKPETLNLSELNYETIATDKPISSSKDISSIRNEWSKKIIPADRRFYSKPDLEYAGIPKGERNNKFRTMKFRTTQAEKDAQELWLSKRDLYERWKKVGEKRGLKFNKYGEPEVPVYTTDTADPSIVQQSNLVKHFLNRLSTKTVPESELPFDPVKEQQGWIDYFQSPAYRARVVKNSGLKTDQEIDEFINSLTNNIKSASHRYESMPQTIEKNVMIYNDETGDFKSIPVLVQGSEGGHYSPSSHSILVRNARGKRAKTTFTHEDIHSSLKPNTKARKVLEDSGLIDAKLVDKDGNPLKMVKVGDKYVYSNGLEEIEPISYDTKRHNFNRYVAGNDESRVRGLKILRALDEEGLPVTEDNVTTKIWNMEDHDVSQLGAFTPKSRTDYLNRLFALPLAVGLGTSMIPKQKQGGQLPSFIRRDNATGNYITAIPRNDKSGRKMLRQWEHGDGKQLMRDSSLVRTVNPKDNRYMYVKRKDWLSSGGMEDKNSDDFTSRLKFIGFDGDFYNYYDPETGNVELYDNRFSSGGVLKNQNGSAIPSENNEVRTAILKSTNRKDISPLAKFIYSKIKKMDSKPRAKSIVRMTPFNPIQHVSFIENGGKTV